ncbi:unnamed protein product, partial [Bubo scandiacus]
MKPPGAVGTLLRALGRRDGTDTPRQPPAPHSFREKVFRRGGVRCLRGAPRPPGPRLQSVQDHQPQEMRGEGDIAVPSSAPPRAEEEHGPRATQRAPGETPGPVPCVSPPTSSPGAGDGATLRLRPDLRDRAHHLPPLPAGAGGDPVPRAPARGGPDAELPPPRALRALQPVGEAPGHHPPQPQGAGFWVAGPARPPLDKLCSICKAMEGWLRAHPQHVAVLHCKGSKGKTGVIVAAYMHYSKVSASADQALGTLSMRKFCEEKVAAALQPSQRRYIAHFGALLSGRLRTNSTPLFLHLVLLPALGAFQRGAGQWRCRGPPGPPGAGTPGPGPLNTDPPPPGFQPFLKIYQSMQLVSHLGGLHLRARPPEPLRHPGAGPAAQGGRDGEVLPPAAGGGARGRFSGAVSHLHRARLPPPLPQGGAGRGLQRRALPLRGQRRVHLLLRPREDQRLGHPAESPRGHHRLQPGGPRRALGLLRGLQPAPRGQSGGAPPHAGAAGREPLRPGAEEAGAQPLDPRGGTDPPRLPPTPKTAATAGLSPPPATTRPPPPPPPSARNWSGCWGASGCGGPPGSGRPPSWRMSTPTRRPTAPRHPTGPPHATGPPIPREHSALQHPPSHGTPTPYGTPTSHGTPPSHGTPHPTAPQHPTAPRHPTAPPPPLVPPDQPGPPLLLPPPPPGPPSPEGPRYGAEGEPGAASRGGRGACEVPRGGRNGGAALTLRGVPPCGYRRPAGATCCWRDSPPFVPARTARAGGRGGPLPAPPLFGVRFERGGEHWGGPLALRPPAKPSRLPLAPIVAAPGWAWDGAPPLAPQPRGTTMAKWATSPRAGGPRGLQHPRAAGPPGALRAEEPGRGGPLAWHPRRPHPAPAPRDLGAGGPPRRNPLCPRSGTHQHRGSPRSEHPPPNTSPSLPSAAWGHPWVPGPPRGGGTRRRRHLRAGHVQVLVQTRPLAGPSRRPAEGEGARVLPRPPQQLLPGRLRAGAEGGHAAPHCLPPPRGTPRSSWSDISSSRRDPGASRSRGARTSPTLGACRRWCCSTPSPPSPCPAPSASPAKTPWRRVWRCPRPQHEHGRRPAAPGELLPPSLQRPVPELGGDRVADGAAGGGQGHGHRPGGPPSPPCTVHFKVSAQGITLTDSQRKLFFRRHYPVSSVTYCSTDPQDRRWVNPDGTTSKIFGFVAKKAGGPGGATPATSSPSWTLSNRPPPSSPSSPRSCWAPTAS